MTVRQMSPEAAKALLHYGCEVALLDVREAAAYGDGHALFAVHCPYSRLETTAVALVPRADVPILLLDDGDDLSDRAAERLLSCGYRDVRVVEGGMKSWARAGFGVFAGVNVPSKTLGELLEHAWHPRTIDARTLRQWQDEGRALKFFDARPPAEYGKMKIPGARCLPNGELAHRFAHAVGDDETPVVITCAGRTRGIVGALGLAALGIGNPVYALENGTQGWALEGLPLDRGTKPDPFPDLTEGERCISIRRARDLVRRTGLSKLSSERATRLATEPGRTTYLFDLRTAEERAERPCPGAVPVLAGQIVQATDQYVGVRHARLIFVCDTGLRSGLSALFLRALGYETHALALDEEVELPQVPARVFALPETPPELSPTRAFAALARTGVVLVDVRPSQDWDAGHLQGAMWAVRPKLADALPAGTGLVILHTPDPGVAAAASQDIAEAGIDVRWLAAGLDACAQAGWSVVRDAPLSRKAAIDRVWFVHDRHDGNREASLQYLSWEMGLIAQLDPQERAEFAEIERLRP
jgi:rhodanese-related sulfurtransferase